MIYKGNLDIHLVNIAKHCSGVYSGVVCPEPCKINYTKDGYNKFVKSREIHLHSSPNWMLFLKRTKEHM
jgi:hypothetical protein